MPKKNKFQKYTDDIKDIPLWLKYVVAGAAIFGTLFGGWGLYITLKYPTPTSTTIEIPANNPIVQNATSTIAISDLLSKALSLDTVVERQDFLTKYVGSQIHGSGNVKQISRAGNDGFLVDISVNGTTVTCPQDANEETEKKLLLLKGKNVYFTGTFTYQNYVDHGLGIGDCELKEVSN